MIDRIGKMLSFKAETGVLHVGLPAFACKSPVQKIACIQLNSGLIGRHLQNSAGRGFGNDGACREGFASGIENISMIVAMRFRSDFRNFVADFVGLKEVHDSPLHRWKFARWNERVIDGYKTIRVDLQSVVIDQSFSSKIEIRVVGEIDWSCGVRRGSVFHPERVFLG